MKLVATLLLVCSAVFMGPAARAANAPPLAVGQSPYTPKNTPLTIVLEAFDPNGDPLTYSIVSTPANGTLSAVSGATVVYTPNPGFSGRDSFTFKASDGAAESLVETVNVIVQTGNVVRVGPARTYKTVAAGLAAAQNYDVVEIDAGTYVGTDGLAQVASAQEGLTIRGVGGFATIDANRGAKSRKGALVVSGKYITLENLELKNAWIINDDGANAAGIRMEGGDLTVRGCYIHDNQDGILTGDGVNTNLLVEYTEFNHNSATQETPKGWGQTHNIYVGHLRNFTLRYSYSHNTEAGHLVKTRAMRNFVLYNRITDNFDGQNSDSVDIPDTGTSFLIGNLFYQVENPAPAGSRNMVRFGEEHSSYSQGGFTWGKDLYLINNTFVSGTTSNNAYWLQTKTGSTATLANNIFMGNGTFSGVLGDMIQITNLTTADALLANLNTFDYHLTSASPAVNAGTNMGSLNPQWEYSHPASALQRVSDGQVDIGAYEYQPCAVDSTSRFTVTRGGYRFNSATQRFVQTVTLTNNGTSPAQGPFSFVLDSLSANASVYGHPPSTACATPAGSPFLVVPGPNPLASGQSVAVTVEFNNPTKAGITYTPRVLAGPGQR